MKNRQNLPRFTRSSLAVSFCLLPFLRSQAEDHVDYRYEDYAEDNGRIHIRTHGVFFESDLKPWLSLKGNYIYDGISGATPTGIPPTPGETLGREVTIEDIRRAGFIEPKIKIGNHSFSPQLSYSLESDYKSLGTAFSHSIEFNDKNTTVTWGVGHSFDHILPNDGQRTPESPEITTPLSKNSTDFLIGFTQLLGQKTVVGMNLTIGYSEGYLSDPYKRVLFQSVKESWERGDYTGFAENRPNHKQREVVYLSLQHAFPTLKSAFEGSYRFHHDDWGINANTLTAQWHQKIGQRLTLSPILRYHTQTRADFYAPSFPGDPYEKTDMPELYSADYRLSELESWTYGTSLSLRVHDRVTIELGYKRYEMFGTDDKTDASQYPSANIVTLGFNLWF